MERYERSLGLKCEHLYSKFKQKLLFESDF